jgi:membrane protease YdiL (CAAX protease family)
MDRAKPGWNSLIRSIVIAAIFFAIQVALQLGRAQLSGHAARAGTALLGVGVILGLYAPAVRFVERRKADEISGRNAWVDIAIGVLVGCALFGLTEGALLVTANSASLSYIGLGSVAWVVSSAALAAVGEEIIFRAALYRSIEQVFGTAVAVVVTALLFGAMHLLNDGATLVGGIGVALESGVLLGLAFSLRRTIWLPVGIHFGWNFTEGGIFGTNISGGASDGIFATRISAPPIVSGGSFGPEASILAMLVCLVASAVFAVLLLQKKRVEDAARRRAAGPGSRTEPTEQW